MMLGILTFYTLSNVVNLCKSYVSFALLVIVDLVVVVFAILSFIKRDIFTRLNNHRWLLLSMVIFMIIPVLICVIKQSSFSKYKVLSGEYEITGRVESCNLTNENATIKLGECVVGETKVDTITLYVANITHSVDVGSLISARCEIRTTRLFTDENNIGKYNKHKVYSAYCISDNFYVVGNDALSITEKVREGVKDTLHKNLNKDNADVAYAMLFGDKSAMSYEVYEAFSFAGISHMLAVSGLHIGFLVGFMTFILSLFHTSDRTNLIVISVVLVFYCTLCDFTASVVRATVMAIVLMCGNMLGTQHDNLSSLSLAGIVILIFNPLNLFDYGFQLSFLCVLAMITLNKYIADALMKIKFPRVIASALAISISVNIAIAPLTAILFGTINIIGIFTNILLIPIFSIAFPLMFYSSMISALIYALGFLLSVPNVLLHLIRMICNLVKGTVGAISVFRISYVVVILMIAFLLILKYLMISPKRKAICLSTIAGMMIVATIFGVLPKTYKSDSLITWNQYSTNCSIITTKSNKKILFDYDEYNMKKYLRKYKINKIDSWVLPSFTLTKIGDTLEIVKKYKIDNLFVVARPEFNDYALDKITNKCKVYYVGEDSVSIADIKIKMFSTESRVYAVWINTTKSVLFDMGMTQNQMLSLEPKLVDNINYCITQNRKYDASADLDNIRDVYCTKDVLDKKGVKSIAGNTSLVIQY